MFKNTRVNNQYQDKTMHVILNNVMLSASWRISIDSGSDLFHPLKI